MEPGAASTELVRGSGTQFDPVVVEALLAIVGMPAPVADERPIAA
jgi:HD-GYP domain-containing protein (c-di-GMP phosphodiesterase class II)